MDRLSALYWSIILTLLTAALFFGLNAEGRRLTVQRASGTINSGDLVRLKQVVDGDTVLVARGTEEPMTVRILGIKSFDAKVEHDEVTPFGKAAVETLQRAMADRPIRVLIHSTPTDRHGRLLATLYAEEQDVGLQLVKQGLALAYTVYPFPALPLYLQEQELARSERRGLWANAAACDRAMALMKAWQEESQ